MIKRWTNIFLLAMVMVCVWSGASYAGWGGLIEFPIFRAADENFRNLDGGQIYFYEPGTTTLKDVYLDIDLTVPAENPYTLTSEGIGILYGSGYYKIDLYSDGGVQQEGFPIDYVFVPVGNTSLGEITTYYPDNNAPDHGVDTGVTIPTVQYYLNLIGEKKGTLVFQHILGNTTTPYVFLTGVTIPQNVEMVFENGAYISKDGVDVRMPVSTFYPNSAAADHGVPGNSDTVNYFIDNWGGTNDITLVLRHDSGGVTTAYTFLTAETIPENITLEFENGAMLVPDSGVTVRYGRAPIASSQCFAGDGVILPIDDSDSISHVDVTWYGETAEGIQKADNAASILSSGGKLIIPGKTYYSTDTITLKTKHIVCDGRVDIVKTLSDSPVIILEAITLQEGNLVASHDARPSTSQTEASGIRFRNVVGAKIDKLGAFKVYNAFENVTEVGMSGEQLSWGNVIARLSIREFVNSAIYWDFPGSGNHTGNIFESIYISGFESDGPVYSEVELPIYFNNADSTVINLLNLEACQLTSTASTFIFLENSTSLNIGALHFERNSCIYPGTDRIFNVSASATNPINVLVDTLYINNFTQGASNTRLVVAKAGTATTTGAITINRVSGAITSNTITDFTLLQVGVDCEFRARIVNPDGWDDFLTSLYTGSSPATAFQPNIFMGNEIVSIFPSDALTSGTTTLSIGAASFVTFTGTAPTSITNIEAVPTITDDTYPVEAIRTVTLENSTSGSITVEDTGNINLDTVGGGPITWSENLILNYSIRADKAYVVAYD